MVMPQVATVSAQEPETILRESDISWDNIRGRGSHDKRFIRLGGSEQHYSRTFIVLALGRI